MPDGDRLVVSAKFGLQLLADRTRDSLFNFQNLLDLLGVLHGPDETVVQSADKVGDDQEIVTMQLSSAHQHCLYVKLSPDRLGINQFVLVAKDQTPRDDFHVRQVGEIVHQAFSQSIAL